MGYDLPKLASWKMKLLEKGIDSVDLRELGEKKYKTKWKEQDPTVENGIFYDASENEFLIPSELILKNGEDEAVVKVNYSKDSEYIIDNYRNELVLINKETGSDVDIDIAPVEKPGFYSEKISGNELNEYIQLLGLDRLGILAYEGCFHWNIEKSCKFCDSNPKRNWEDKVMPSVNSLWDYNDPYKWWEENSQEYLEGMEKASKKILESDEIGPHKHLAVMAGNLPELDAIWEVVKDVSESLNRGSDISKVDSYLNVLPPNRENLEMYLEKASEEWGFNQLQINLEVFGEKAFQNVCPGKQNLVGFKYMRESLEKAVDYFGEGKVRSNFVLGAQPINELLKGVKKLADSGVVADYSVFIPKKKTPWENREKPDTEKVVDFTKKLAEIYREHGFEPIYCEKGSRSNIVNEVFREI